MSEVISILREDKGDSRSALYALRKDYCLTLLQAATALKLSTTQLEREELRQNSTLDLKTVQRKYELFCASSGNDAGRNLIFGCLPLRTAREIRRMSLFDFAREYGFSESHWKKVEANARELDPAIRARIEADVQHAFGEMCARATAHSH
jgi:hypothetical protein